MLGPAKLPCYKRVLLYIRALYNEVPLYTVITPLLLTFTDAAGFTSKRFAHQITHNRTVNLSGKPGHNLSTDTFMDIMNHEFRGENIHMILHLKHVIVSVLVFLRGVKININKNWTQIRKIKCKLIFNQSELRIKHLRLIFLICVQYFWFAFKHKFYAMGPWKCLKNPISII